MAYMIINRNKIFIISLFVILTIEICSARLSGLYIDNGLDQTVIERSMSYKEKQQVEHEILDLLGLPNRPRKVHHNQIRKSAPKFLLDIYKSLSIEESNSRSTRSSSDLNLTGEDLHAIDESEVIMSFQSHNHHVAGVRHERGRRLWFDVSEVTSEGEGLVRADLRLYKTSNHVTDYDESNEIYTITAYEIISSQGEKELEFVSAINITSGFDGWLELNITSALLSWINNQNENKGLYLSVYAIDKPAHEIRLEDIGLINSRGDEDKQPFMVGFFKANPLNTHLKQTRSKNGSRSKRETNKRQKKDYSPAASYYKNPLTDPIYSPKSSFSCQIKTLYVSFKDLQWQDWIIAPDGYGAFYCAGECNFPLNAHMNATNHAIVQTLVHLMNPTQVPKPCCAPTKLYPISVLYYLEDSNVILKRYKNMAVKSCGCH